MAGSMMGLSLGFAIALAMHSWVLILVSALLAWVPLVVVLVLRAMHQIEADAIRPWPGAPASNVTVLPMREQSDTRGTTRPAG